MTASLAIETEQCPLCGRECPAEIMERHHLRTRHRDRLDVERICRECHRAVHALFANRDLAAKGSELASVEGLLADERFQRALTFIRKVPPGARARTRLSNAARRRR